MGILYIEETKKYATSNIKKYLKLVSQPDFNILACHSYFSKNDIDRINQRQTVAVFCMVNQFIYKRLDKDLKGQYPYLSDTTFERLKTILYDTAAIALQSQIQRKKLDLHYLEKKFKTWQDVLLPSSVLRREKAKEFINKFLSFACETIGPYFFTNKPVIPQQTPVVVPPFSPKTGTQQNTTPENTPKGPGNKKQEQKPKWQSPQSPSPQPTGTFIMDNLPQGFSAYSFPDLSTLYQEIGENDKSPLLFDPAKPKGIYALRDSTGKPVILLWHLTAADGTDDLHWALNIPINEHQHIQYYTDIINQFYKSYLATKLNQVGPEKKSSIHLFYCPPNLIQDQVICDGVIIDTAANQISYDPVYDHEPLYRCLKQELASVKTVKTTIDSSNGTTTITADEQTLMQVDAKGHITSIHLRHVPEIPPAAFRGLQELRYVWLHNVKKVGKQALSKCPHLHVVVFHGIPKILEEESLSENPKIEEVIIHCSEAVEPSQTKITIGPRAFYNDKELAWIEAPDQIGLDIGQEGLGNCSRLSEINHILTAEKTAFNGCYNLNTFAFIQGAKKTVPWYSSTRLNAVYLPSSFQNPDKNMFCYFDGENFEPLNLTIYCYPDLAKKLKQNANDYGCQNAKFEIIEPDLVNTLSHFGNELDLTTANTLRNTLRQAQAKYHPDKKTTGDPRISKLANGLMDTFKNDPDKTFAAVQTTWEFMRKTNMPTRQQMSPCPFINHGYQR